MHAVMLRNIRTRFFGHGLGYLVALGWPLAHILFVIALFGAVGRAPPLGESTVLFIATGAVPFQIFSYSSRFMMQSLLLTRPLLSFPEVKVLDVLFASAFVEILSSVCVILVLLVFAWYFEIPAMPRDVVQASYAMGAAVLLGVGSGVINGVIVMAVPFWFIIYTLFIIAAWATAGIVVPDVLPEPLVTLASYHPLLQVVEWMRSAYYEGLGDRILDRPTC